jgi:hypothetical protein
LGAPGGLPQRQGVGCRRRHSSNYNPPTAGGVGAGGNRPRYSTAGGADAPGIVIVEEYY